MAAEASTSANHSAIWSDEATTTLIEAWGEQFHQVNRGNISKLSWDAIVDTVNSVHGTVKTYTQCRNRLDVIKKRFKTEKTKTDQSNGDFKSSWRLYERLEFLIGNSMRHQSRKIRAVSPPPGYSPLPIECQNGTIPVHYDENGVPFVTNEAMENDTVVGDAEEEEMEEEEEMGVEDGWKRLVKAVEGFGEVYERVESTKMKQMVELEKERMRFAKELELHRMKLFVDMQVHLEKTRVERAGSDEGPSRKRSRKERT